MRCSLLILNHQGREILERNLPSVVEAARPGGHEVVVVDNSSTDGSVEAARDLGAHRVLALTTNDFLLGLNEGARQVDSEVVLLLNNDVAFGPECLERLLAPFARDEAVFGTTGRVYYPDRVHVQAARILGRFREGMLEPVHLLDQFLEPEGTPVLPTLYLPGGASAVRRDRFLELGGFDRLYLPLYWEDVDLSYAAWRRGWKCLFDHRAVFVHEDAATMSRVSTPLWRKQVDLRNSYLAVWKNVGDRALLAGSLRSWAFQLRRALVSAEERWMRKPLLEAMRRMPAALASRRRVAPGWRVPDLEILPRFVPGLVRAGLGRGTPMPGDLFRV